MWLPYPAWLSPGDNAWQMTAATLVGLMSVPGLVVLYGGVMQKRWSINSMMLTFAAFAVVLDRVGAVGLQDGLRHAVPRHLGLGVLRQLHREAGHDPEPLGRAGSGRDPVSDDWTELPLPAGDARLLPVRVRGDHADPDARLGARPDQLQGLDPVRRAVVVDRLHRRRVHDLGRRLLRPARRGRLLRRLRDPPVGRRVGLRRRRGDRTAAAARPRDRRPEQRRDGRGRRGPAVARLERLQRRRPVLRRRLGLGCGAEHEPLHRGRVPGLGRLGLHDRSQAGPDLRRQRHDRRPGGDHPGGRLRQRLGRDRDRGDRLDDRLLRAQLHEPAAAVPQRRRHPRRDLHPRRRRPGRRAADGRLRRPEDGRLSGSGQDAEHLRDGRAPRQLEPAQVAAVRRLVRDRLVGRRARSCCSSSWGCSSRCECRTRTSRSATPPSTGTRCTRPTCRRSAIRTASRGCTSGAGQSAPTPV